MDGWMDGWIYCWLGTGVATALRVVAGQKDGVDALKSFVQSVHTNVMPESQVTEEEKKLRSEPDLAYCCAIFLSWATN